MKDGDPVDAGLVADDLLGAIPWCEKAVAASPSWIEPRLLLARVYLKLERPAAAGTQLITAPRGRGTQLDAGAAAVDDHFLSVARSLCAACGGEA